MFLSLGLIPTTFCIGKEACQVEKLFRNLNLEIGEPSATAEQPISHMFLFDRQMDMVSTLMTALTYESLLNDNFTVKYLKKFLLTFVVFLWKNFF